MNNNIINKFLKKLKKLIFLKNIIYNFFYIFMKKIYLVFFFNYKMEIYYFKL